MSFATLGAALGLAVAAAAPAAVPAAPPAPSTATSIVVYDQVEFKGRSLTFDKPIADLAAYNFDDRVASLTISGTRDWVLCENRNFAGRCVRVQVMAEDMKLLQMQGRVSSLYPVPVTP